MIMARKRKALSRKKVDRWLHDHIRRGLREASAGTFASEAEVKRVISRLRPK
jgi:predicted transcriptional regulator